MKKTELIVVGFISNRQAGASLLLTVGLLYFLFS